MEITAAMVKELRQKTGVGVMDCKRALVEADGDLEKAILILREKGSAVAEKRMGRAVPEGIIESYIHTGNRIGVLLEINCETDFVARTDDFQELANDIAMQIAAKKPLYVSREDVPEEIIEKEKGILRTQALNEGKPEKVVDKIVEGRLNKFFSEVCLLEQEFIKDSDKTIKDLILEKMSTIGENIVLKRFTRYELGESDES
ncbi:translation elongation factor Ts [Candidatus Poribacteria bacterium]|nr:translation elongation factor Ts [Candidatus Poribacteria bacterium]